MNKFSRPFASSLLAFVLLGSEIGISLAQKNSSERSRPVYLQEEQTTSGLTPEQAAISWWVENQVKAKVGVALPRQNSQNLDTLYQEAALANPELHQLTLAIARETGGTAVFPPGKTLKSRRRTEEKIMVDYGGDASFLTDIARSSVEYSCVNEIYQALRFLVANDYDIVRIKDRFLAPMPSGFRNIHLNLRMSNGHIVELQLHLKEILGFSIGEGHKLYEQVRSFEARAFMEGRLLTLEEQATINRLNQLQKQFYDAAFQRASRGGANTRLRQ